MFSVDPVQCNGTTQAGRRCRILAAQHDIQLFKNQPFFCGYHVVQQHPADDHIKHSGLGLGIQCNGTMQAGRRCKMRATPQETLLLVQNQPGTDQVFFCEYHLAQDLSRPQCSGTTHAGMQCRIRCPQSVRLLKNQKFYCHYHVGQELIDGLSVLSIQPAAPSATKSKKAAAKSPDLKAQAFVKAPGKIHTAGPASPSKAEKYQPAYIYAYTLDAGHSNVHVFENGQFKPLAGKSKKGLAGLLSKTKLSKEGQSQPARTLIKIGYTTQTPTARLAQWQDKCRHSISLLAPSSKGHDYDYDFGQQGWPIKDPTLAKPIEGVIHKKLWALYGKGNVLCEGCVSPSAESNGQGAKDGDKARRNVHIEWFLIPNEKKAFETIYKVIEDCIREGSA